MFFIVLLITVLSIFLIIYHHLIYPFLMKLVDVPFDSDVGVKPRKYESTKSDNDLPSITLLVPAYNEQDYIEEKIQNIGILDYPRDKLKCIIACDGCDDKTYEIATYIASQPECKDLDLDIIEFKDNQGKVAVLNSLIPECKTDLIALSDTSAILSCDALLLCAKQFENDDVGVVNGAYRLLKPGSEGEEKYWDYQRKIKAREAKMGASIGSHGAFYVVKRSLVDLLPPDTINDDFVLPMRIVSKGYKSVYIEDINSLELDKTDTSLEVGRRQRIGAGNIQQLIWLKHLLLPKYGGVAFNFISGKALRTIMPILLLAAFGGSVILADSLLFLISALLQGAIYGSCYLIYKRGLTPKNKLVNWVYYLVQGYCLCGLGMLRYLVKSVGFPVFNSERTKSYTVAARYVFQLLMPFKEDSQENVRVMKRAFDITIATTALVCISPLLPLIILAIKLDSPGPVFYWQTRIGYADKDKTTLFKMVKFRTMGEKAESVSGAVWATKNDSRVTGVGRFLRKTRLDEIPQLYNVIKGEMSIVGPRPERPCFYSKLENAIPYFADRTYGVLPGITGLAQVNQGYDTCIEDVRRKVGFDHSYALSLLTPSSWIKRDLSIIAKTVEVMVLGRGQ